MIFNDFVFVLRASRRMEKTKIHPWWHWLCLHSREMKPEGEIKRKTKKQKLMQFSLYTYSRLICNSRVFGSVHNSAGWNLQVMHWCGYPAFPAPMSNKKALTDIPFVGRPTFFKTDTTSQREKFHLQNAKQKYIILQTEFEESTRKTDPNYAGTTAATTATMPDQNTWKHSSLCPLLSLNKADELKLRNPLAKCGQICWKFGPTMWNGPCLIQTQFNQSQIIGNIQAVGFFQSGWHPWKEINYFVRKSWNLSKKWIKI